MKRIFLFAALLSTSLLRAQTVDEVIQKYTQAMGGLDAFNKVTTAKMTATMAQQSMEMPVVTQIVVNKAARTDVSAMGFQIINVYNNGTGWKQNHFAGVETPTPITGAELTDAKGQISLLNHLMDYKARGHKVELAGKEDVEGVSCFKINLINKDDGKTIVYFIAVADYILVKSVASRELQGQDVEIETFYSDYKTFGGIKFPMVKTQKVMGQNFATVTYTNIELNVPVDEAIFKM